MREESQLRGIGPMILFLGFHPVTMSASSEYCLFDKSTAGKCVWTR